MITCAIANGTARESPTCGSADLLQHNGGRAMWHDDSVEDDPIPASTQRLDTTSARGEARHVCDR